MYKPRISHVLTEALSVKRLENLGFMQDVWADFATATPVVSARGSGLDPGILRSTVLGSIPQ